MSPEEITLLYKRIIKLENDLAELSRRPIPTDYSSVITKLNQDIIHLKEIVSAQQIALEAHGNQLTKKKWPFINILGN